MNKKKFEKKLKKALIGFQDRKGDKAIKLLGKVAKNPSLYL